VLLAAGVQPGDSLMVLPYAWHGAGETLVLIAGLGAKGTSWQPFLDRAARSFRVLTFDNRGSGDAPPLAGPVAIRDMAHDALALLDRLGVERARIVGRSMGGMIAQELALLAPERVDRLVLVSTTARVDAHLGGVFALWADMAEQGVPAAIRHRSSLLWCLGSRAVAEEPRVRVYLEAKVHGERTRDYALQARACAEHDAQGRPRRAARARAGGGGQRRPLHAARPRAPARRCDLRRPAAMDTRDRPPPLS
jgi:3-oxoadipate enol-lactonase